MTQLSPTTLLYGQAIVLLEEFKKKYASGEFKTAEEIGHAITELISKYSSGVETPIMNFKPFVKGEPALSARMNEITESIQHDVNLMQNQVDLLKASTVFLHNFISTEIQKAEHQNARVAGKMKTLQLYSTASDINLVNFGDYFINEEFIDSDMIDPASKASLTSAGVLSLGRRNESINVIDDAEVRILPTSNGFAGNNQEIQDPMTATTNPTTNEKDYRFVALTDRRADLDSVIDSEPNTWFEYEHYFVSEADRNRAKNLNFTYANVDEETGTDSSEINWALGPSGNVLKLDLEFDLGSVKTINNISYTPYGLTDNKNHPVKVTRVHASSDNTNWESISSKAVWIGTDANIQAARASDEIVIGTAVWPFDQKEVRYIRLSIEQPNSISSNIGHVYYVEGENSNRRVLGPVPPITDPTRYHENSEAVQGNLIKKVEYFNGQRWAIGIRDCSVEQVQYNETSYIVTKPFRVNGIIDRVALEADIFIPSNFGTDEIWVKFYISPDDGLTWVPISRVQDDIFGIKEVISFNDPLPEEFREDGVDYRTVKNTVNSLRLKIEMSRPADKVSSSPIVRSYKLKVRLR